MQSTSATILRQLALAGSAAFILLGTLRSQCGLVPQNIGGGFNGGINEIATIGDDIYIGGNFSTAAGMSVGALVRYDGTTWDDVGGGLSGLPPWALFPPIPFAHAVHVGPNGDVFVGGQFAVAGGVPANSIARWDGSAWHAMGSGPNAVVHAIATLPNGDVVVGGAFTQMGGVAANYIARWDGANWSPLGSGVAAGPIGTNVRELAVAPNGDVIVVGSFTMAGGVPANGVARWDGTSWSAMGNIGILLIGDAGLAVAPNGDVFLGGSLSQNGAHFWMARWDGSSWTPVPHNGPSWPRSLQVMPNGDVLGMHSPNSNSWHLSRWDGSSWHEITTINNIVSTLALSGTGDVYAGGVFSAVGGTSQFYFAALATPCAAGVAALGPGCVTPHGTNTLVADNLPWAGATFRAEATGLPPISVAAVVTGYSTDFLPLSSLFASANPLCLSLTSAEIIEFGVPSGGALRTSIDIPNAAALAGQHLYHQVIPFGLHVHALCFDVSSTNALDLTIGFF